MLRTLTRFSLATIIHSIHLCIFLWVYNIKVNQLLDYYLFYGTIEFLGEFGQCDSGVV